MSLTIASILAESAERHADRTAVVLGDLRMTYAQLWGHTKQYAAVLRQKGIAPGDKVALLLPNTPHFPLAYFGTLALGAIAVPVHALLKAEEIQYVLEDSGAKVLICAAPLLAEGAKGAELAGVPVLAVMDGGDATLTRIDTLALSATPIDAIVPTEPDDTAVILYTSGTTMLLVEQDVGFAFRCADRVIVLEHGQVAREGPTAQIAAYPYVKQAYLGVA